MGKRFSLLVAFGIKLCFVALLLSCSGGGMGKSGTLLEDETILLDMDSFHIQFIIDDSTLCVRPIHADDSDCLMVVRKVRDRLYRTMVRSRSVFLIYLTDKFVRLNDTIAYELETGKNYSVMKSHFDLMYLGKWGDQLIFSDHSGLAILGRLHYPLPRRENYGHKEENQRKTQGKTKLLTPKEVFYRNFS